MKYCGQEPKIAYETGGSMLIETSSPEGSKKLQLLKLVSGLKAKCSPHLYCNQVRGVIHSRELLRYSKGKQKQGKLEIRK